MFSFFMPQNKNPDDYTNEVIDRLGKFVEVAKGSGVDLCHENEKGIYGDIAIRCLNVLKAVPELKGVFDPANFIQSGQETLEAWDMLKSYIKYFHVKDAFSDGSVVPAGKGEGKLDIIVPDYIKNGGTCFTMEPHLAVFKGLDDLEQEGNESVLATRYVFDSNEAAFDAACDAFKALL
jgi:sugar phosphate isomerase/epimerase